MLIAKKTIITLLATIWASQSFAGYQITVKNSDGAGSHGKKNQEVNVVKMTTDSGKARIDFTEGQAPGAEKGSYLLTKDNGQTFLMVIPENKTYMKWDMDAMMGIAGAMGNMMQMKITDPKVETLLDEAGESILGYPTRHYKLRTSYRLSMTVMGFKNESTISKDEETWSTTKLDLAALGAWVGKVPKTKNESLDQLIQNEKSKVKGFPLKMLSTETATDSQGKTTTSKSSMEVTEIKTVGANNVSFEVPADYQEMSLPMTGGNEEEQPKSSSKSKRTKPKLDFGALMKQAMEQAQ
jgi:hypothetical protein